MRVHVYLTLKYLYTILESLQVPLPKRQLNDTKLTNSFRNQGRELDTIIN